MDSKVKSKNKVNRQILAGQLRMVSGKGVPLHRTAPRWDSIARLVLSVVLVLNISHAFGEHEANHRYELNGYVLNEDQSPIASTTVIVSANGSGGRGTTAGDGYYSVRLHLHDADLGRELRIKTQFGEGVVRADFDPGDLSSARVHRVDIIGGRLIEGQPDAWSKVPRWVFYVFGLSILIIFAASLRKTIRKLKKRLVPAAKVDSKANPKSSKSRPKRKKRKRR
jgi:hypothetical protein